MPNWGDLASMAGKVMGKKKEKKADGQVDTKADGAADWAGVGQSIKQASADGKVSNKEIGDIAKDTYAQYSKDKKDGTAPKPEEIGKKLIGGFFKKK